MDRKTIAVISYLSIIGWVIAYFQYKDKKQDPFVAYHLKQALGIAIISILLGVAINVVVSIVPALSVVVYANIIILVLWVMGILNAMNGLKKPVPVVGPLFEHKFGFLNTGA